MAEKKTKYVFVNWDPLFERPVCVHSTQEGTCKKCEKIMNESRGAYHLEVKKFKIKD